MAVLALGTIVTAGVCVIVQAAMDLNDNVIDGDDDKFCDDDNNNGACAWDGGDCCGDNVNKQYCTACKCLDPEKQ